MKRTMAGLTLFTALSAVAGQAFAEETWHCIAHPPGFEADTHEGFDYVRNIAIYIAMTDCYQDHHVECVLSSCTHEQ